MTNRRAFTLVEILIVVIILGVLAAIVVPQFSHANTDATASSLRSTLHGVQSKVSMEYQRAGTGNYPTAIDTTWFTSQTLPQHPENAFGIAAIETVNTAGLTHPANKMLTSSMGGAFWYNRANGMFRARVANQGSSAATLDFYNLVNNSNETSLGNYTGGSGS
jgi:prepilin-type N-terminal cleavage/methylation domain-containing protein